MARIAQLRQIRAELLECYAKARAAGDPQARIQALALLAQVRVLAERFARQAAA